MPKFLKAKYSCDKCGIKDVVVEVRERYQTEDVVNYVHHVGNKCGLDHGIRSPLCNPQTLTGVYVPMSQNGIGFSGSELTPEQIAQLNESKDA
jgi:hypothetical protein